MSKRIEIPLTLMEITMEYLTEELMKDMENEVVDIPQSSDWRVLFTEGIQQVEDTFNSTLELCTEIPTYFSRQYQY